MKTLGVSVTLLAVTMLVALQLRLLLVPDQRFGAAGAFRATTWVVTALAFVLLLMRFVLL